MRARHVVEGRVACAQGTWWRGEWHAHKARGGGESGVRTRHVVEGKGGVVGVGEGWWGELPRAPHRRLLEWWCAFCGFVC